jgi:cytochrome oxidase assembly protein ShyY1
MPQFLFRDRENYSPVLSSAFDEAFRAFGFGRIQFERFDYQITKLQKSNPVINTSRSMVKAMNFDKLKEHWRKNARRGEGLETYVVAVFIAIVLFAIGLAIAAPLVNSLTTGATPIIGPTTTNGSIVGYVVTFFILGVMLAIIGGAIAVYKKRETT